MQLKCLVKPLHQVTEVKCLKQPFQTVFYAFLILMKLHENERAVKYMEIQQYHKHIKERFEVEKSLTCLSLLLNLQAMDSPPFLCVLFSSELL